jgi:hypothetical protein
MNETQSVSKVASSKTGWLLPLSIAGFVVAYFGARLLLKVDDLSPALRFVAALIPAPAFLVFIWAMVRGARKADELQRRIQLEALAIAWPLAVGIVMTISLLQKAGFLEWEPMWVYLPLTYFLGLAIAMRRFQ